METPVTAVVFDSNAQSREATAQALARAGVAVLAISSANRRGFAATLKAGPGLVFVSAEQPLARAVASIEYLAAASPEIPVVAFSSNTSVAHFQAIIRAGARYLIEAPLNQAELDRVLASIRSAAVPGRRSRSGAGRVIAVVGQKGGVGKTAISVNLAAALAQNPGNHVLIIDFDMSFGDVGLAMNVSGHTTAAQLAHDLTEADRDDFKASLVPHPSGAFVLGAPSRVGEWLKVTPAQLESLVDTAAALFDYVILDTPGAFNDAVASAMEIADNVLVVTSLELSSVKNTALLLDVLEAEGFEETRALVVANCTSEDTGVSVPDLVPALKRASIWKVPFDPGVRKGTQVGQPVVVKDMKSPASLSIRALASRIETAPDRIDRRAQVREESSLQVVRGGLRDKLRVALARMGGNAA